MKTSWLPSVTTWIDRLSTSGASIRGVAAPARKPVQAKAAASVVPCSRRRRGVVAAFLRRPLCARWNCGGYGVANSGVKGRAARNPAAACSTSRSASRGPASCSPTGNPAAVRPQGTEIAGPWLRLKG